MPYSTRPATVSRYLAANSHIRRSRMERLWVTQGYTVSTDARGDTIIRYNTGTGNAQLTTERRRQITREAIQELERTLSQRYTVIMFEPDEGNANYRLTVRPLET